MARTLSWPVGLRIKSWQPLSGPRTVGGGSSESVTGFVQTASSAFGSWSWQLSIERMKGRMFRLYRGMVTASNGGANAIRVPFCDPDGLSWEEAGVTITADQKHNGVAWSNGQSWSNGKNWQAARPSAAVSAAAAEGDTIVSLADQYWGHALVGGEWIGFYPFHFGLYVVTQVIEPGEYRVWPPLRKALPATGAYATLRPVMAMRLQSESGAGGGRSNVAADNATLTLVEVQDPDARDFFAD